MSTALVASGKGLGPSANGWLSRSAFSATWRSEARCEASPTACTKPG